MGVQGAAAAEWTSQGALPDRLVDDLADGPCAAAALGAAAEAAIDLPRRARRRGTHRGADVLVAENIAGADNHAQTIIEGPVATPSQPDRYRARHNKSKKINSL